MWHHREEKKVGTAKCTLSASRCLPSPAQHSLENHEWPDTNEIMPLDINYVWAPSDVVGWYASQRIRWLTQEKKVWATCANTTTFLFLLAAERFGP